LRGVDARDAGDQEEGVPQVEALAEHQRGDRGRDVGVAHARGDLADVIGIAMHRRVVGRQARHPDLVGQLVMVDPALAFGAEHADDQDLDGARTLSVAGRVGLRGAHQCQAGEQGAAQAAKPCSGPSM